MEMSHLCGEFYFSFSPIQRSNYSSDSGGLVCSVSDYDGEGCRHTFDYDDIKALLKMLTEAKEDFEMYYREEY